MGCPNWREVLYGDNAAICGQSHVEHRVMNAYVPWCCTMLDFSASVDFYVSSLILCDESFPVFSQCNLTVSVWQSVSQPLWQPCLGMLPLIFSAVWPYQPGRVAPHPGNFLVCSGWYFHVCRLWLHWELDELLYVGWDLMEKPSSLGLPTLIHLSCLIHLALIPWVSLLESPHMALLPNPLNLGSLPYCRQMELDCNIALSSSQFFSYGEWESRGLNLSSF